MDAKTELLIHKHFQHLIEGVETEKAAWEAVGRMDSYLTALTDVGVITEEEAREKFTNFFDWADYEMYA